MVWEMEKASEADEEKPDNIPKRQFNMYQSQSKS